MKFTIYQIDAFADKLFSGNPAAVIPLDTWIDDSLMQQIAEENNLAETVFLYQSRMGFISVGLRLNWKLTFAAMPHWLLHLCCLNCWNMKKI